MAKIRMTKNELKRQKDNLRRFVRYLPTLDLKKKQLLIEIRKIQSRIDLLNQESDRVDKEVYRWADLFTDRIDLRDYISVKELKIGEENVAGIDIPVFEDLIFDDIEIDYLNTPVWIDEAIRVCKEQLKRRAELEVLKSEKDILNQELRITIQRIKLFEEVKIPEAEENIRIIKIFLGDVQTAEVVRGKIAKAKILSKREKALLP